MKKSLLATFVALSVGVASAASVSWTISGVASKVIKDYSGESPLVSSVYLVLSDSLAGDSFKNLETEAALTDALSAITVNGAYSTSDGKKPSVKDLRVDSNLLSTATTNLGLLVYSKDTAGNGYYKVYSTSTTPWTDNTPAADRGTLSTSWASLVPASWVSAWTKPTEPDPGPGPGPGPGPIPEPATGALALAGVALLFKRRRA